MSCCLSLLLLLAAVPAGASEWVVIPAGERQVHAYVARPQAGEGKVAVVLIHEIFGLSDWVLSVADRLAAAGYIVLAPDLLSGMGPEGGRTPDFADQSALTRAVSGLPPAQVSADLRAVTAHVAALKGVSAVVVAGFCWGGSTTNFLAARLGPDVKAAVPFYGAAADTASVPGIKAALLIQYAESDERINALWPAYEAALKASGAKYEVHTYPGTQHGFHNNSTPRYQEAAAKLAWDRTIAWFKQHLA